MDIKHRFFFPAFSLACFCISTKRLAVCKIECSQRHCKLFFRRLLVAVVVLFSYTSYTWKYIDAVAITFSYSDIV